VTPEFFFQVFAKNSLTKNLYEEEKKFNLIVEHDFFSENSSQLSVFWPRRGLQTNHRTVRKSAIFPQPSKKSISEAMLLMSINEAVCFQDKTLRLSSSEDLILYEGDSNF